MSDFRYDVAIIGTGRVGLPLGLLFAEKGLRCIGIDRNKELIDSINRKEMPFGEPEFEKIIKRVDFTVHTDFSEIASVKNIIITVGTPLLQHMESDLSQINAVVNQIVPYIQKEQVLILRSTVSPKTTLYIKDIIEERTDFRIGKDFYLAFCPERIVEGRAYEELTSLPQIIGAEDEGSYQNARALFLHLTSDILKTTYISAELAKLYCNINRYMSFAVANYFAYIADHFNQDIYSILYLINYNYPRGRVVSPGFTAGTCLRKDFGMLNEVIPYSDMFISAWKVNEYMPKFLVESMVKHIPIKGKRVAVLGYTFKRDVDDIRDSLVPKLLRYLEREVPNEIRLHDPHLDGIDEVYTNYRLFDAIHDADIVYIGINHTKFFEEREFILNHTKGDCYFSDIWNVLGTDKIVFQKTELNV